MDIRTQLKEIYLALNKILGLGKAITTKPLCPDSLHIQSRNEEHTHTYRTTYTHEHDMRT